MLYMYVPEDDKVYVLEEYQGDGTYESLMATRAGNFLAGVSARLADGRPPGYVARIFTDEARLRTHLHGLQEDPEFVTI